MTAVLVRQAQFASTADLRNGIDGDLHLWIDGGENVLKREAFQRWQIGRLDVHFGFSVFGHLRLL